MRGQVVSQIISDSSSGITPADAGTRKTSLLPDLKEWDHPRGCGDKLCVIDFVGLQKGSPPRMRGQVPGSGCSLFDAGITPADAGTSPADPPVGQHAGDHPRGCGDKSK